MYNLPDNKIVNRCSKPPFSMKYSPHEFDNPFVDTYELSDFYKNVIS